MVEDTLYRREILRLAADATGAGRLTLPDVCATVHNPVCGDRVSVELTLKDGKVTAFAHTTQACILTQAAAALLASQAPGLDHNNLQALSEDVRSFLKGGTAPNGYGVFDGVADHAGRHICVLLPLNAALKALATLEDANPSAEGAKAQTSS